MYDSVVALQHPSVAVARSAAVDHKAAQIRRHRRIVALLAADVVVDRESHLTIAATHLAAHSAARSVARLAARSAAVRSAAVDL